MEKKEKNNPVRRKKKIVDHANLPQEVLKALVKKYPLGYHKHIVKFRNAHGDLVSAILVETEEVDYMVKVGVELKQMVDDFDYTIDFDEKSKPSSLKESPLKDAPDLQNEEDVFGEDGTDMS